MNFDKVRREVIGGQLWLWLLTLALALVAYIETFLYGAWWLLPILGYLVWRNTLCSLRAWRLLKQIRVYEAELAAFHRLGFVP